MKSPKIEYIGTSVHDAQDWLCDCGTLNKKVRKLIFAIPRFSCSNPICKKKYLDKYPYDFCLADVTVNGMHLVQKVLNQRDTEECMAYAIVQALHIMHIVDVLLKKDKLDPRKLDLKPAKLYGNYNQKYPCKTFGSNDLATCPGSDHKLIRMALELKNNGFPLGFGKYYRIGGVSVIPKDDYEEICEQLANGVPLIATFYPGISFGGLEYCKMYFPAHYQDVWECNAKHPDPPHIEHVGHAVVLIGPAFRIGLSGFFFLNADGEIWCPRKVLEEMQGEAGGMGGVPERWAVKGGIGKVHGSGLFWNLIKFSHDSECAEDMQFVNEEEEGDGQYEINQHNFDLLWGRYYNHLWE
ncbi:hypothetical protein QOZ80_6BG0459330 [Eleusine coracana subsp. coracana]|nr:hypothetical protein QOZ80_6BG0459330 [Eleusine coracana subsp. coracana]